VTSPTSRPAKLAKPGAIVRSGRGSPPITPWPSLPCYSRTGTCRAASNAPGCVLGRRRRRSVLRRAEAISITAAPGPARHAPDSMSPNASEVFHATAHDCTPARVPHPCASPHRPPTSTNRCLINNARHCPLSNPRWRLTELNKGAAS
jgi:hypothetical protein